MSKIKTMARMKLFCWLLTGVFAVAAHAAPESEYWALWDQSNEKSVEKISHSLWQELLTSYLEDVSGGHYRVFDYRAVTAADDKKLDEYLQKLQNIDPRKYSKAEQFAYWVNLYNARTVAHILDNYPVESITKTGSGWFSFGPWNDDLLNVAGTRLTLNDIEHRILRPLWQDKRIHYVVNCASLGCPDLPEQALTAENHEIMLEVAATRFIRQPKGASFTDGRLALSRIYEWYADDFGERWQDLQRHLAQYLEPELKSRMLQYGGPVEYQYDWKLNEPDESLWKEPEGRGNEEEPE